mgnify:CR=1 FL=1
MTGVAPGVQLSHNDGVTKTHFMQIAILVTYPAIIALAQVISVASYATHLIIKTGQALVWLTNATCAINFA